MDAEMDTPCSHPKYRIESVEDFLNVPEDRLSDCLAEFHDFLELLRPIVASARAIGEAIGAESTTTKFRAFTWIDDGKKEHRIRLTVSAEEAGRS